MKDKLEIIRKDEVVIKLSYTSRMIVFPWKKLQIIGETEIRQWLMTRNTIIVNFSLLDLSLFCHPIKRKKL
jgi:hypothetical protein